MSSVSMFLLLALAWGYNGSSQSFLYDDGAKFDPSRIGLVIR